MDSPQNRIDMDAYLARIEYTGPTAPSASVLAAIHRAHAAHIPFENIDVLMGVPIRLDLPSLEAKLVRGRRGGYCFEQNMLLAAALEQLGFRVKRLQARVRFDTTRVLPLTHMALEVVVENACYLADVGFGGRGLIDPVVLIEGDSRQGDWKFRLARLDDRWWVLQAPAADAWGDLYVFTRDPYLPVDYEPANFYVSHHPDSRFVQTLTVQLPLPRVRYLLIGREYTTQRAEGTKTETLEGDDALLGLLAERFGLELPAGDWIPPLGEAGSPE